MPEWEYHEIDFLKEHYGGKLKASDIASKLNRTLTSTYQKAFKLGLCRYGRGLFKERAFDLKSTWNLGRLCGLILGDGSLYKSKSRNYGVRFGSTRKEFISLVDNAIKNVGLKPFYYNRIHTRRFPNGSVKTDLCYYVMANSKILYSALLPYKGNKEKSWSIPKFLTGEGLIGFLCGIYEAEGWVSKRERNPFSYVQIGLCSKFKEGLSQIKEILQNLGISPSPKITFSHGEFSLMICRKNSVQKFKQLIKADWIWRHFKTSGYCRNCGFSETYWKE